MICIFNPEHDLCLANGNRNFVPPASALRFASQGAPLMQILYPGALCCSAPELSSQIRLSNSEFLIPNSEFLIPNSEFLIPNSEFPLLPWAWDLALKTTLLKQGVPADMMPTDDTLEHWRQLQHRSTVLPLQPQSAAVTTVAEAQAMIDRHTAVVLKAPWSGSGRGIRWVTGALSQHDALWLQKIVREQRCVIVEPRWQVQATYALEYRVSNHLLQFVGYSLFESASGVYQYNLLLPDDEISRLLSGPEGSIRSSALVVGLESWLQSNIAPYYEGPLGVDFILSPDGIHHLTELNLRHTMGLVAHEYLRQHPNEQGRRWRPCM